MPIPEEDDITKQQLWKRIDDSRNASSVESKDVSSQIDQFKDKMGQVIVTNIDSLKAETEKGWKELMNIALEAIKDIRVENTALSKKLEAQQNTLAAQYDKKITAFHAATAVEIKTKVDAALSSFREEFDRLKKIWALFERNVRTDISVNRKEVGDQLGKTLKVLNETQFRVDRLYSGGAK